MNTRRALLGLAPAAFAQPAWPTGPVRLLVGFAPGGGNDVLARIMTEPLAAAFGQPFLVENRPGGSGTIAIDAVRRATPDGQTLLVAPSSGMTINPLVLPQVSYDPLRDFAPISLIGVFPLLLVVPAASPLRSLADLVALARAEPGRVNYSSASSSFQVATEMLAADAAIRLNHIPYRGSAPAVQALLTGEVAFTLGDVATVMPLIQGGQLRPLAVSTEARIPALPGLPTIAESGLPGYRMSVWSGLFAPVGTPLHIIERLHAEIARAIVQPATRARLAALGVEAVGSTPAALAATMAEELERFGRVVRSAEIRLEN